MTTPIPSADLAFAEQACRPCVVKERMLAGRLTFSLGIQTCFNSEMALMAERSGYDALLMNLEHGKMSLESCSAVSCACLNVGITPIVVVPALSSDYISRALDVGVQGIIVPRIGSAADAKLLVRWAKYRPLGDRPLAEPPQACYTPMAFRAAMQVMNDRTLAMCMIETLDGLENVEAIAAVPGVDCLFVGTFDLLDEMGITGQYDDPRLMAAYDRIATAAKSVSVDGRIVWVGCGGLEPRPDLIRKLATKHSNIRYFMGGRDSNILLQGMRAQSKGLREIADEVMASV